MINNSYMIVSMRNFRWLFWAIALHSFGVFVGLVFFPSEWFEIFGYHPITEPFFRVQGGVFHLVMVVAYLLASQDPNNNRSLVVFSFSTKFIATLFLFLYFFLVDHILVVLLSGLGDFAMGCALLVFYLKLFRGQK